MKSFKLFTAAVVASAAVFTSAQSMAQSVPHTPVDTPVNPGFFYWSLGASGGVMFLPTWRYGQRGNLEIRPIDDQAPSATPTNLGDAYSYNPKPWGAGPEFVMGYALNKEGLLGGLGHKPRIEFGLTTFFGSTSQSSTPASDGNALFIPAIDGSTAFTVLNDGTPAKLKTTVYAGEAAIRLKTEFGKPRFKIIPSVGAIGGMAIYRYQWGSFWSGDFPTPFGAIPYDTNAVVKETIRSWHVGGEFALQVKWTINPKWSLSGGAAFALMSRHSHLRGHSEFNNLTTPVGTLPNYRAEASDNKTELAWRLGITYDWGWARVTVSGFGYYDSAVPQVDNPRIDFDTGAISSARLTSSGEWAYGGRVAIVFPLYKQPY